jgi:hypothetical protein
MKDLLILLPLIFLYFNMDNKTVKKNMNSVFVIYGLVILYYFHNRNIVEGNDNNENNENNEKNEHNEKNETNEKNENNGGFRNQVKKIKKLIDSGKIGPYHEAKKKYEKHIDREHAEYYKNKIIEKLDQIENDKDKDEDKINERKEKIMDDFKKWIDDNDITITADNALFITTQFLDSKIHISDEGWYKSNTPTKIKKIEKIIEHISNKKKDDKNKGYIENGNDLVEGITENQADTIIEHKDTILDAAVCVSGVLLTCLIGGAITRGKTCRLVEVFCDFNSFGDTLFAILDIDTDSSCEGLCTHDIWYWSHPENADERPQFDSNGNYVSRWIQNCSHYLPHCDCVNPFGNNRTAFNRITYDEQQFDSDGNPTDCTDSEGCIGYLDLSTQDKVKAYFENLAAEEEELR